MVLGPRARSMRPVRGQLSYPPPRTKSRPTIGPVPARTSAQNRNAPAAIHVRRTISDAVAVSSTHPDTAQAITAACTGQIAPAPTDSQPASRRSFSTGAIMRSLARWRIELGLVDVAVCGDAPSFPMACAECSGVSINLSTIPFFAPCWQAIRLRSFYDWHACKPSVNGSDPHSPSSSNSKKTAGWPVLIHCIFHSAIGVILRVCPVLVSVAKNAGGSEQKSE